MGRKSREKRETPGQPQVAAPVDETPVAAPAGERPKLLAVAAILLTLVAIVYAQLRTHQFLNYDDPIYVTSNEHVQRGLTAGSIRWAFTSMDFNWHPLTWLTHMLDVELFGIHAGPPLLVNALLHAASSVLLLLLLVRATGMLWRSSFVAALFAVHPLHVESVAWIAERKDVLSTLFFLLTLYLYVRFTASRSKTTYAALTATFILGLMSKGMLVTLPFVLLLLDFWPLRRLTSFEPRALWKAVLEKLPLFVIVVPAVIVTYEAQRAVASLVDPRKAPLIARLANGALSYVAYIGKMFWPAHLALPYPYRVVMSSSLAFTAAVFLVVVTVAAFALRRSRPWFFTGWLWFAGTLVPVIGIVQIGIQSMADRYTYIPMIGLFIAITWLAGEFVERHPRLRPAAWAAAVVVIASLTAAANVQAGYWKDSATLFAHTLENTRRNPDAHVQLGEALLNDRKDPAAAARQFEAAIAIYEPNAAAHHNLAVAYVRMGRFEDAVREYRRAIEIEPANRKRYGELASVEAQLGRNAEAGRLLAKSAGAEDDPGVLASLALERGDLNQAISWYEAAVVKAPDAAALRNDYAAALAKGGRDDEAQKQYEEALRLDPSLYDARMNFGALLSRRNRNDEAIAQFEKAASLRSGSTEPHVYLALAYAQAGRQEDAAREAEAAMKIDAKAANDQFTAAVRMTPDPNNLRGFITSMHGGR